MGQTVGILWTSPWVALYENLDNELPKWVFNAGYLKDFRLGPVQISAKLMGTIPRSLVGSQYLIPTEVKLNA